MTRIEKISHYANLWKEGTTLVMNNGHNGCHCPGYKKKYYMPVYKKEDHYEGTLDDGEYGHEEEESY
ncbi:hypothetical protein TYRP_013504 [Tyrophagus putrescentiae]|nr:hypothetical protein TYRP_013504 [Tyrophagus putrescentiae]